MEEIRNFLEQNGYVLRDIGEYWTTVAHYRDGKRDTSLNIHKRTGAFKDWVAQIGGSFKDLVALISGQGALSDEKLKELLARVEAAEAPAEKIKVTKVYDETLLDTLLPDYRFFSRRFISEETQRLFQIGFCTSGKLRNRYVVPVFCHKTGKLVGLTGRYYKDQVPDGIIKWKHLSSSANYLWPMHLNDGIIRDKKEIIIVESPGDLLALWEAGKKNTICSFGTKVSPKAINYITGIFGLKKIWISTNNDEGVNDELAGNRAAEKWRAKLLNFFNEDKIEIVYPPKCNDWGEWWEKKNLTKSVTSI